VTHQTKHGRLKALFLDRDGIINVDKSYVWRIDEFEFMPGIFDLCRVAQAVGLIPIVVTNQAGIGRGYYTERDFRSLTEWMLAEFLARGIRIGRVYHCPYHPTAGIGEYRRESFDRKPNPGMILRAKDDFDLDLSRSVLLGDMDTDIAAGRAADVGYNVKLARETALNESPEHLEFATLHDIGDWLGRTFVRPSPV
jgi:D-glycero-D-manno-heptose 1,7-bisphosphate phosphatase